LSLADKLWQFDLEDGSHTVRLVHGYFSGHRDIFVDGKLHEQTRYLRNLLFDSGSRHEFEVSGHRCVVCIIVGLRTLGFFKYHFFVDDCSIDEHRALAWQQPPIPEP
jgi:hypothetical protein